MSYRTCDHLKADGVYCSSPALRDQRYCYFHLDAHARRVQAAHAQLHGKPCTLQIPILDNMHAVQAAIQHVVDALAAGRIQNRRAALLLYSFQQAATGLNSTPEWKGQRPEIAADEPLSALEVDSLQRQYGIPYDANLDAPPDVAAAEIDATVALSLDARPGQTEQASLARVPARPNSQPVNSVSSNVGSDDGDLRVPGLVQDPELAPDTVPKLPPASSTVRAGNPSNAA